MNPILPSEIYVPDVEAHVADDGRIYLYGSLDIGGDTFYCSDRYHVFSSADLKSWTDHGESFHLDRAHCKNARLLFAPDCFFKDGKAYLLYCGNDGTEGIAEADSPAGPFGQGFPLKGADQGGIDPSALVDEDGSVYYFWGQFHLKGAKLTEDLRAIDPETFQPKLLNESDDGFHEGSSIRKRNGIYYLVYADIARGKPTCLSYATSTHPLGPYEKQGVIIDNDGCDPESWNNHGSIEEFNGQWLVFYHRSSQNSRFNRRVCAEPITFNEDGSIPEVKMTTQGLSGPLDASVTLEAWRACQLEGKICTAPIRGEGEVLTRIHNGNRAFYRYLDFGEGKTRFHFRYGSRKAAVLAVVLESDPDTVLASVELKSTGDWQGWQEVSVELAEKVSGVHGLVLSFHGINGRLLDLKDFRFS